jgi:hydrogenase maturation protease
MNHALVDKIAQAVLYEGYILYPYRPSVKNRQRWTFGGVYPQEYCAVQGGTDSCMMQTECLLAGDEHATLKVKVRFLHLIARTAGELAEPVTELPSNPAYRAVESLHVAGKSYPSWQEAVERELILPTTDLGSLTQRSIRHGFVFPGRRDIEPVPDAEGVTRGVLVREQQPVAGVIELSAEARERGSYQVTVRITNRTSCPQAACADRDQALMRSLVSTHTILGIERGEFMSMIDPPAQWKALAAECRNIGAWPVLVGETGSRDAMLSAPIILYDYPQIAPESPGDLFDGTEIDEILTLRILTLTDAEKQEMLATDERARELLQRTEALAREQLMGLHGTIRGFRPLGAGGSP